MLYNVVSIPIAAGLFMPFLHQAIPPDVAGLAMALSSVSVLTSSLLLKGYRPPALKENHEHVITVTDGMTNGGGSGGSSSNQKTTTHEEENVPLLLPAKSYGALH